MQAEAQMRIFIRVLSLKEPIFCWQGTDLCLPNKERAWLTHELDEVLSKRWELKRSGDGKMGMTWVEMENFEATSISKSKEVLFLKSHP